MTMTLTLEENLALTVKYAIAGDLSGMEDSIRATKAAAFHRGKCISERLLKTIKTIGYKNSVESMIKKLTKHAEEGDAYSVYLFSPSVYHSAEWYLALQYGLFQDHDDREIVKFLPEAEKKLSKQEKKRLRDQSFLYAQRLAKRMETIVNRSYQTGLPVALKRAEEEAAKGNGEDLKIELARLKLITEGLNIDVSQDIERINQIYADRIKQ